MIFMDEKGQIIIAVIYTVYQMGIFFVLGTNLTKYMSFRGESIAIAPVIGYFIYYTLFEVTALPMKIMGNTLAELSYVWSMITTCILLISIIKNIEYFKKVLSLSKRFIKYDRVVFIKMLVLILVNFIIILSITPQTMGVQDDSYYIADAVTTLYTNKIQQYNYVTGDKLSQYIITYFIPMYPIHGAVIGKLLNLHPIIENKWCSVFIVIILNIIVYYLLAKKLYKGDQKKSICLLYIMEFFHINYVLWGKSSGTFFYFRISEGKGILSNLVLPALILCFWEANESKKAVKWLALEAVILGGLSICMSSAFLIPVALAGLMAGVIFKEKNIKKVIFFSVLLIPCICVLIVYEILVRGWLSVPIL